MKATESNNINFNEAKVTIIGIALACFLIPTLYDGVIPFVDPLEAWLEPFVFSFIYTTVLWSVLAYACKWIWIKFPMPEKLWQNVFLQLTILPSLILIIVFSISNLIGWMTGFSLAPMLKTSMTISFFASTIVITIYNLANLYSLLKLSIKEKEQLEKENVQSQLEVLKNQVNPHFLFNSLNTLTSLIPEEPKLAINYVQKLSRVYRYILEIKDQKLIPLEEELSCVTDYLFMLKIRFGENLKVEMAEVEGRHDLHIVPLSVQMLIENAVKHNIISKKKPLTIKVLLNEEKELIVQNNLQKKEQVPASTGTGLENIKSRYQILSGQKIAIQNGPECYEVRLPVIQVKNWHES